jgi:hypothetical protein
MVGETVKSNIKSRLDSGKALINNEISTLKETADYLKAIKPVQGAVHLVVDTIDNVGKFIKEQCEITRRWM